MSKANYIANPNEVKKYISRFDPETEQRLLDIRSIAATVFPNSEETVWHAVPTFMYHGKDIFNYGAYKDHITLYVGYDLVKTLKEKYPKFQYTKGTVQFLNKDSFPYDVIKEICALIRDIEY